MTQVSNRDYHIRRAREELDLAYRAEGQDAAAAHLRLSSFHMQRARSSADAPAAVEKDLSWLQNFAEVGWKCVLEKEDA